MSEHGTSKIEEVYDRLVKLERTQAESRQTAAERLQSYREYGGNAVAINLGEAIEPGTELKPGNCIRVDSSGNVTLEQDTREKLEADVRGAVHGAYAYEDYIPEDMIIGWLDRQAAITEREVKLRELYKFEENHRANIDATEEVNRKLNERIAELTAERDKLKAAYLEKRDTAEHWHHKYVLLQDRMDELIAEVEKQRQRANDAERGALSDEWYVARDRYEDDVAALTAERDRYEVLAVNAEQWKDERDQLSRKLTAEHVLVIQFEDDNERMREAIDAMGCGQFYAMYRAKCDECERLKRKLEKGGSDDEG